MTSNSALIIGLNEEDHIASCLESVTWADEVIVVDAGSTDRTVQIASRMGAKVLYHPWEGYAPQRRFALEKAHNEWILALDAAEIVSENLRKELQERVGKEPVSGYTLSRLNHFIGKPVMHCGWYPDRIKRCFRNSAVSVPER